MSENRLRFETSPYLLQHKDNPVHWWAWNDDALAEAKRTGKPILLSVGYAACHWCHVMAHESFEDDATADVMNQLFINIKVDREERPDIDAIYMGALHRLGEQGGWPLTMFLDSDARPFWGGTYFPKQARYGRPAFATVLLRIAEVFQNQPEDVASNATQLIAALKPKPADTTVALPDDAQLANLAKQITRAVDPVHGGLNGAPKFPQWSIFWFLWRAAIRFDDADAKRAVLTTLTNICQGGIYDHLGGGFARYSVDEFWLVPHFEKMLYDNALLLDLLTEAWRETHDPLYAQRISETVDWFKREMITADGGFSASLDADSEGEEGKFYVWSHAETRDVLGNEDAAFFASIYDITDAGNFEGHNIPNRLNTQALGSTEDEARLTSLRAKLRSVRDNRIRPSLDDKVLADWNGLMIAALSRAAIVFGKPDWLTLASQAFACIAKHMAQPGGRLWHSYRNARPRAPGTASDYANMTWAAIRLYEATLDDSYLQHAKAWSATLNAHFRDPNGGGYFTSADDTTDVIVRMKTATDDAVPNANAIQVWNLTALAALTGDSGYDDDARALSAAFAADTRSNPVSHCGFLAQSMDLNSLLQVVEVCEDTTQNRTRAAVSLPGSLELHLPILKTDALPDALAAKLAVTHETAIFVCRGQMCLAPIRDAELGVEQLQRLRRSNTPAG
jgi:uncharacterized protein